MITEEQAKAVVASMRNAWSGYTPAEVETLLQWARQELARREAEQAERAKPIDAEWLLSLGNCIRDDMDAFGVRLLPNATAIMERPNVALSVLGTQPSTVVHGRMGNQAVSVVVGTRGQLLDLLAALKGGAT